MKKSIVWTVIIFLLVLFAYIPVVNADQSDSVTNNAGSDLQELPEMDMTGLHTDIEMIEIDHEITNATQDWIVLAHDDNGKKLLIEDIESSDHSVSEKNDTKDAVRKLWDTYPVKFEDAGQKTIDIKVQSDGANHVTSIPVGHVTRITFDKEKIRQVAKDKNNSRLMTNSDKPSAIVLSETENNTVKNITNLRLKKIKETSGKSSNPSSSESPRASSSYKNSYSSGFSSSSSFTSGSGVTTLSSDGIGKSGTGLIAWSGSDKYSDPIPSNKNLYTGHNAFAYQAAIKANLQNPDTAAMAARYPDDVIDNKNPTPLDYSWLDTIWHSWNHGYIPNGIIIQGHAPERCAENAAIAQTHYTIKHDYIAASAYFGNASHYLTDVGNPLHTGRAEEQYHDIQSGYNTHEKYETYVENNWIASSTGTPYGQLVKTNKYYYTTSDPNRATKNLGTFSNTYLDTLFYRVRNNPHGDAVNGFPADPTVRLITENCIIASARYTYGLAKYIKAESTTNSPPAADFAYQITSYDGSEAQVILTDTTIGQVDSRDWDFGDSKPHQSAKIVTHTYYPWNDYRAVLTVSNAYGTTQKKMDIPANHVPPLASFVYTPSNRLTYQFVDTSKVINADCDPTSWEWDFGDDSPVSFERNPKHTYEESGLKPIKFTAKNIYGNNEAFSFPLSVQSPIEATIIHAINQFIVHFSAESTSTPSSYEWNFGDGTTSTEATPTHEYINPGTYNVKLTVKDPYYDDYNITESSITVPSQSPPLASFTAAPRAGSAPLTVTFTDTSTGIPTGWSWNFGDNDTTNATEQHPVHTYTANGTYTVSLNATNDGGPNTTTRENYICVGDCGDKIGVFRNSTHKFYLDKSDDGKWGIGDVLYSFGNTGDLPIAGDWNNDGKTEIGTFRNLTQTFYLDKSGNGSWGSGDKSYSLEEYGDLPVAGDWNNDGKIEIGVFRDSTHKFYLDVSGDGKWGIGDVLYSFGNTGDLPVAGDWNNDGTTEIGVFRPSTHKFYLDVSGDGKWDISDESYSFGNTGDLPVAGDWNNDGTTEIGVFRDSEHKFYLDVSGNGSWGGGDKSYLFGDSGDSPLAGRWG